MDSPIVHEGFGLDGSDENVDYEKVLIFIQENRLHQVGATANKARKKLEAEGKLKNLDEQKPSDKEANESEKAEKNEDSEKSPDPKAGKSKPNKIGNLFKLYTRTIALTKKKDPPKKDDEKKLETDEKIDDKSKEILNVPNTTVTPAKSSSSSPTPFASDEKNENAQKENKQPIETPTTTSQSQTPTSESQPAQPANEEGTEDANKKAPKLKTFGTIMRFFSKPPPKKVPSTETPPLSEGELPSENPKLSDATPPDENKNINNSESEIESKNSEPENTITNETKNKSKDKVQEPEKDIPKSKNSMEVVKSEDPKKTDQDEQLKSENEQKDDKPLVEDKYPMPKDDTKSSKDKKSKNNKEENIIENSTAANDIKSLNDNKNITNEEITKKLSPEEKKVDIPSDPEKNKNATQITEKMTEDKNDFKNLDEPKTMDKAETFKQKKQTDVKDKKVEKSEYKQDKPNQPEMAKEPQITNVNADIQVKPGEKENFVNIEEAKKPKTTTDNEEKTNEMRDQEIVAKPEKDKTQNKSNDLEKDKLQKKILNGEENKEKLEISEKLKKETLESIKKLEEPKKSEYQEKNVEPKKEETPNKSDDLNNGKPAYNVRDLTPLIDQEKHKGQETREQLTNEISEKGETQNKSIDSEKDKLQEKLLNGEGKKEKSGIGETKKPDEIKHDQDANSEELSNLAKKDPEYNNKNLISKKSNDDKEPKENDKDEIGISKATKDSEKKQELKIPGKINEADKTDSKVGNLEKGSKSTKISNEKELKSGSLKPLPSKKASETGKTKSEEVKDEKKSLDPDKKSESFKPKPPQIDNLNKSTKSKDITKATNADSDKNKSLSVDKKRPSISKTNKQVDVNKPSENNSSISRKKSIDTKSINKNSSSKYSINIPEPQNEKTFKSDETLAEDDKGKKDGSENSLNEKVVTEEIIIPSKKPIKEIVAIKEVDDVLIIETEISTGETPKTTNKNSVSTDKHFSDQENITKPKIVDEMETKSDIMKKSLKKETPFEELEVDDEDSLEIDDQVVPEGKRHVTSDIKKRKSDKVKIKSPGKRSTKTDRNIKSEDKSESSLNEQKKELGKPSKTMDKNLPTQTETKKAKPFSELRKPSGSELDSPTDNGDKWKETSSETSINDWYEARSDLSDLYINNDEQVDDKFHWHTNSNQDTDKLGPSKIPIPIKNAPVKTLTCVGIQTDFPVDGSTKLPSSHGSPSKKPMRSTNNTLHTLKSPAANKSSAISRPEVNINKPIKLSIIKRPPMRTVLNKPVDVSPIGFSNISNLKTDKSDSKLKTKLGHTTEDFPRQSRTKVPTKIDNRMLGSEQLLQRKLSPDSKRKANLSADILDSNPQSQLTTDQKTKANLSADALDIKSSRTPSPEINKRNNLSEDILSTKRINYINSITSPFPLTQTNSQENKIPMKLPTRIKRPTSASPTRGHAMEHSKMSSKNSVRRSDDDMKDATKSRDPCKNNICKSRRCTCLTQSAEDLMNFSNASSILKMTFVPPNKKPSWRI